MALTASIAMTGIAIALLCIYGADVAATQASGDGFLPLDDMQRGIGLGMPAIILPIAAFAISFRQKSALLGVMIIISGILIAAGAAAVLSGPPADSDRSPAMMIGTLVAPAIVQLALGGIKIARSR